MYNIQLCPLCRTPYVMAGVGSVYFPPNGQAPIAYELCVNCGDRLAKASEDQRMEIFEQVEKVLEEKHHAV